MAKIRVVNTRFWIDDYISNLDPIEKLMFLYFLTNPMTDICGIYEIPLKIIAVETGIEKEMVMKILKRFERDNKIFYLNGWVAIRNFQKYQTLNPKVRQGIENGLTKAPKEVLDRLSIDYEALSHLNPNSNSNLNSKQESTEQSSGEIAILIKSFEGINPACKKMYGNTTQRKACENLIKEFTFDRVKTVIEKTLPRTNKIEYMPTITTPLQLFEKWSSLEAGIMKLRSKKETNSVAF